MRDQNFTISDLGEHVKLLVTAAFAVVSIHHLGPRGGLWPGLLMYYPYEKLVPQQWEH
jgi:hypothetical protein